MWRKLAIVVVTFWIGSLWMTGLTASVLFDVIVDRSLAGEVAGHLFATVSCIGLVSGAYLLLQTWMAHEAESFKRNRF